MTELGSLLRHVCMLRAATLLLLLSAPLCRAQDYAPLAPLPLGGTLLNVPTPYTLPAGTGEIRFTHRFSQPVNEGDADSLWGLDSSADIGIGVAYGMTRDLELGIFRSDVQDNWELAAKYALLRQARDFPLSISVRGGADIRTENGLDDRVTPFAQVVLSRRITTRLELFATPSVTGEVGVYDYAFNVPFGVAWMIKPYLSIAAEIVPENGDRPDGFDSDIGWSIGLKRAIGGHFFEFVIGDTRATHVSQYATSAIFASTDPAALGGLDAGDVFVGFNIERRWGGK